MAGGLQALSGLRGGDGEGMGEERSEQSSECVLPGGEAESLGYIPPAWEGPDALSD